MKHTRRGFATRAALRLLTDHPDEMRKKKDAQRTGYLKHSIYPCFGEDPKVLIVGTFPSPKSRSFGFFYGHPQNRFWHVMADVFHDSYPVTREERISFVKEHHLALWDVVGACTIQGARDQSIKDVKANPLDEFLKTYGIDHVFATGKKAGALYMKYVYPKSGVPITVLPSTSPANCAVKIDELIKAYQTVRKAVENSSNEDP